MRAARYCFTAVRLLVVGDCVCLWRGDGMEQVMKVIERAKNDLAYQERIVRAMEFNRSHGMSNEMYAGVIGFNNKSYKEKLCYGTSNCR